MAELPFMPFYVDDFEGATPHLTLEEDGAYNRLLRLCWRQADCSLPNDHNWIQRMLRVDKQTFSKIVAPLLAEYFTEHRGRIFQKRLREEFLKAKDITTKRRAAGKMGGKAKAQKTQTNHASTANNVPEANEKQKDGVALASTTTTTTISTTPPYGGVGAAPPFVWEQALFAIPGVKGSGLEVSAYPAMVQLHLDGFDLQSEVHPRPQRAHRPTPQEQGRANRLSWTTIAKRVREAREDANRVKTNGSHSPARETIEAPWEQRLATARQRKQWPAKWGPWPNQPGCLAPAALVHPDDGKGWTDWKVAS